MNPLRSTDQCESPRRQQGLSAAFRPSYQVWMQYIQTREKQVSACSVLG